VPLNGYYNKDVASLIQTDLPRPPKKYMNESCIIYLDNGSISISDGLQKINTSIIQALFKYFSINMAIFKGFPGLEFQKVKLSTLYEPCLLDKLVIVISFHCLIG